jgi:hypothetical protein
MQAAQADFYRLRALQVAQQIVQPKHSPLALFAVLCAVGGLFSLFVIGPGAALPEFFAVLLGHFALKEIRDSNGRLTGTTSAKAALFIAYGFFGLAALGVVVAVILVGLG